MKYVINPDYKGFEDELIDDIVHFETRGTDFGNQKRNSLKLFQLGEQTVNVKSFRIPNVVNQIAYRFFRKSKAQRSYEYAHELMKRGIGTPKPIAYFEFPGWLLFKKSYYVSDQLDCDLTYRELTKDLNYPEHEAILRAFVRFTFELHEKEVHFLDHSPGNTLIKKVGDHYQFFLVDLNRMEFRSMDLETRIKNMSRLTKQDALVKVMSDEYAKLVNEPYEKIYDMLWYEINAFQSRMHRKKTFKRKLLFKN